MTVLLLEISSSLVLFTIYNQIGRVLQCFEISFLALLMFIAVLMLWGALFHNFAAFLEKDSLAAVVLASWFRVWMRQVSIFSRFHRLMCYWVQAVLGSLQYWLISKPQPAWYLQLAESQKGSLSSPTIHQSCHCKRHWLAASSFCSVQFALVHGGVFHLRFQSSDICTPECMSKLK